MTTDAGREPGRMRRQAVAMDMLHRLRPGLLHEFRGPLQAILSAVYLLEKKHEAASVATGGAARYNGATTGSTASSTSGAAPDPHVALIRKSVQQLLAFVEALLTDGGSAGGGRQPVDLAALTRRPLHLLRDRAALLDVALELAVLSPPDALVEATKEDLELALTVLLVCTLDRAPPRSKLAVSIAMTAGSLRWTASILPDASAPVAGAAPLSAAGDNPGDAFALEVAREILADHAVDLVLEDAGRSGNMLGFAMPVAHTERARS